MQEHDYTILPPLAAKQVLRAEYIMVFGDEQSVPGYPYGIIL